MGTGDNRMVGNTERSLWCSPVVSRKDERDTLSRLYFYPRVGCAHKYRALIHQALKKKENKNLRISTFLVTMRPGFESKHLQRNISLVFKAHIERCTHLLWGLCVWACCCACLKAAISVLWMWKTVSVCAGVTFWPSTMWETLTPASRSWTAYSTIMRPWLKLVEWVRKTFFFADFGTVCDSM